MELKDIASQFAIDGTFLEGAPYGSGHINDTYCTWFNTRQGRTRYILQRINHFVFKDPVGLMENVSRVTSHIGSKIKDAGGNPLRETLTVIPTKEGKTLFVTQDGNFYRMYVFIEGARTYDQVENLDQVYQASYSFGNFQKQLADMPGGRLNETIAKFHHTKSRFGVFLEALKKDVKGRAASVKSEVNFVLQREADASRIVDLLAAGKIPERATHNDTKLNNVMLDDITGKGICVIDLDTLMPGVPMYDFGDSVRIGTSTAPEDETDLSKVRMDIRMFDKLTNGYLDAARDFLIPLEKENLAFSGKLLTFECGIRFLTDYLSGDVYFKIKRENHNLDRCRTQFKMVSEMERQMGEMEEIVRKYS